MTSAAGEHTERIAALTARLNDPELYRSSPFAVYQQLREEARVAWCEDPGYWVLTGHAEVVEVGIDPERFCSSSGILVQEIGNSYDSPPTMMHTDPPAHTRYRRLVQPSFKPSSVRSLEDVVRAMAVALINEIQADELIDIVEALSVPYPLQVICELLGTDAQQWRTFYRWSEAAIPGTEGVSEEERSAAQMEMWSYLHGLAVDRREQPREDVISQIATATIDGEHLEDYEVAMFLIQLLVAGNETTRNLISTGLVALAQAPLEWARLRADRSLIPSAVEELLRYSSPVVSFMRTATRDTELAGQAIKAGDPVLMVYAAANRDPSVFGKDAESLRVDRDPNPHLALGFGTHFCLGAVLARLEARVVLEELLNRFARIEVAGLVERSPSSIIAGLTKAQLKFLA